MRKKNNVWVWGVILIAIVLIFGTVTTIFLMNQGQNQFSPIDISGGSGFVVSSITPTTIISNSQDLANANFRIETILSGTGESLVGTLTPSQFSSLTENDFTATYPLSMSASAVKETANYNIVNDQNPIHYFSWYRNSCPEIAGWSPFNLFTGSCSVDAQICPAPDKEIYRLKGCGFFGCKTYARWCLRDSQIGSRGTVGLSSITFDTDLLMSVNGETIVRHLTSKGSTSTFGGNSVTFTSGNGAFRGTAQFAGSLSTMNYPPEAKDYAGLWVSQNAPNLGQPTNTWMLTSASKMETYRLATSSLNGAVQALTSSVSTGQVDSKGVFDNANKKIGDIDALANSLINPPNDAYRQIVQQPAKIANTAASSDGSLNALLPVRVYNPVVIWTVTASWLGIKIPVGQPSITGASCNFPTGSLGTIRVNVRNIGSAQGTFDATISSCDPIQPQFNVQSTTIQAGGTGYIDIPVTESSTSLAISKTCTVTVTDRSLSTNRDTDTVTCSVKADNICTPNAIRPDGKCLLQCRADGQGEVVQKCCDNLVPLPNGQYDCQTSACNVNSDCSSGYECKSNVCVSIPCTGADCGVVCNTNSDCSSGKECVNNLCKDVTTTCDSSNFVNLNPNPLDDKDFKIDFLGLWNCQLNEFLNPLKYILIGLSAILMPIISILIGKRLFGGKKASGTTMFISAIVGLLLAGLVGVFIWIYLTSVVWLVFFGLILYFIMGVIYMIIKAVVPFT